MGYKVLADENVDPGRYGFRIVHDNDKPHYFSSDEQLVVREWMKALMKATITRDYTSKLSPLLIAECRLSQRVRRPSNVLVQHSHHSLDRGTSHESRTTATFADCTRCHAEGPAQREPESVVQSGCAGASHGHAQQEPERRACQA